MASLESASVDASPVEEKKESPVCSVDKDVSGREGEREEENHFRESRLRGRFKEITLSSLSNRTLRRESGIPSSESDRQWMLVLSIFSRKCQLKEVHPVLIESLYNWTLWRVAFGSSGRLPMEVRTTFSRGTTTSLN